MPPDDSNEFFGHLNQPATPRRIRKPSSVEQPRPDAADFSAVPDPFGDDGTGQHPQSGAAPQSAMLPGR
ncbi:MAG: hypothetical protein KDB82_10475, partial [Planctomycetes bacterium]|nr:hypothetical protein [Planctomycetota bacterium]